MEAPGPAPERADLGALRWLLESGGDEAFVEHLSLDGWWRAFRDLRERWSLPVDQALLGGFTCDRLGYAFAAGYQSALRALVPSLATDRMTSFSVTEEGGAHPRAIMSQLRPPGADSPDGTWRLSGHKRWATLAGDATSALVVASTGHDARGRSHLRVAQVPLDARGVSVRRMPPPPFVPEIQHAELVLDDVAVAPGAILPGDGYVAYVKPFRTIEDIHVVTAVVGHLLAVAGRFGWSGTVREQLVFLAVGLRILALTDPSNPQTHLGVAGAFGTLERLLVAAEPEWVSVASPVRERWQRDVALLGVAGGARTRRTEVAWGALRRAGVGLPGASEARPDLP
jgi:hypothetical protein